MENRVYTSINTRKGIIAVSFTNPITGKKTTKSLGKKIGLNESSANAIVNEISEIINDKNYYEDYEGYLEARSKFQEISVKCVFFNTDLLKHFDEEQRMKTVEKLISIKEDDGKTFIVNTMQFVGSPGSGKTKTIQQMIGSIDQNTPASTTSNTTVGSFEAYLTDYPQEEGFKKLEMVASIMPQEDVLNYIAENIRRLIIECLINDLPEDSSEKYEFMYKKLVSSMDMKLRLYLLVGNYSAEKYKNLLKEIDELAKKYWNEFCLENNYKEKIYRNISKEQREKFQLKLEETEDVEIEIQEKADRLIDKVKKNIIEVIQNIIITMDNADDTDKLIEMKVISEKGTFLRNSLKVVSEQSIDWVKTIYFSMGYKEKQKKPDATLRNLFFNMLKYISCADENNNENNLFPVVSNLRIKGNFRPKWIGNEETTNEVIIVDSEGVGHDVDNVGFSTIVENNMLYSNKILWIIDSTKDFGPQEKYILETISINGCLPKVTLCFNRLEEMDERSEFSTKTKLDRISLLLDNLFKSFEKKPAKSGIDYTIFKNELKKRMLTFEYLDRRLDDGIIIPKDIEKLLCNIENEELKKNILENTTRIDVSSTIKSFEKILEFEDYYTDVADKNEEELPAPIYSLIKLSNICDSVTNEFKENFIYKVMITHWNAVRAFNYRMISGWNNREWWPLKPESELKTSLKEALMLYFMNPVNYTEENKEKTLIRTQMIQEELAKLLSDVIKDVIYTDNKTKWEDAYQLSGKGSGNQRKYEIGEIIKGTFDRNRSEKNIIFTHMIKMKEQIHLLKEINTKFEI